MKKIFPSIFILCILYFTSCKSKEIELSLEEKIIKDGKVFAEPETNIFSSRYVKSILKNFPLMLSEVLDRVDFYFPNEITQDYAAEDVLSFFEPENIWLSDSFCGKVSCPDIKCSKMQDGNNEIKVIDVRGDCFNDVFYFSGSIRFEESFSHSGLSYKLDFKDWYFRGVETKESVFYSGNVSFSSLRDGKQKFLKRNIKVKGGSSISDGEFPIEFEQEFFLSEISEGATRVITEFLNDYRNYFCFATVSQENYLFSCERVFNVRKLVSVISQDKASLSGYIFMVYSKDIKKWFEINFSVEIGFENDLCRYVGGFVKILSGGETLNLRYDKYYGENGCDFVCPKEWIWKIEGEGETKMSGCLP